MLAFFFEKGSQLMPWIDFLVHGGGLQMSVFHCKSIIYNELVKKQPLNCDFFRIATTNETREIMTI